MIKHTFIYFIGKILPGIINIIAISIYTRLVSPEEYGLFSIIIVTGGLLNILVFQWLRSSLMRFHGRGYNGFYSTIIYLMVTLFSILFLLMLFLFFFTEISTKVLIYIFIFTILTSILELSQIYFRTNLKPIIVLIASLIKALVTFVISYILISRNIGLDGLILGAVTGLILSISCFAFFLRKKLNLDSDNYLNVSKFNYKLSAKFFKYGLPLTLSFALGVALQNIDKYMVTFWLGLEQNGAYSVSYDLVHNILYMIMTSLSLAGFPIVLKTVNSKSLDEGKKQFYKYIQMLLFISIPTTIGLIAIKDEFSMLFIGENFKVNSTIVTFIAIATFFQGMKGYFFDQAIQISTRTKYFFLPALTAILLNICLNFFLLPIYELNGAAFATLISFFVSMVLSAFYSFKVFKIELPYKLLCKVLISSLTMLVIINKIELDSLVLTMIAKIVLGCLVYVFISITLNTISLRSIIMRQMKKFIKGV